ncbi:---NA--- [Paramuricea clavata]|uniref:---NA n=1 Tax=Paramuricea clavata TaxID=317549 RepID=A0A7D9K4M8_PARCT|nr:---NA--- [Paramuricea clavata]
MIGSLPEEFKPLITALDAVGENNLSYEKVKGMLLNVDRKSDTKKNEDAFSAKRGFGAKGKRWSRYGNTIDGGHFARDCPKKNPKNKKFANKKKLRTKKKLIVNSIV